MEYNMELEIAVLASEIMLNTKLGLYESIEKAKKLLLGGEEDEPKVYAIR